MNTDRVRPPRIIILGGGFAGAYCAQQLEKSLRTVAADIWLIDRHNYFVFYPFLVEASTGSLEPRHAVVSIRSFLDRTQLHLGTVIGADPARHCITFTPGGSERAVEVAYDHLVVALGSVTRLPAVPGLAEHGFQLKSLADGVALRDRAIRMLELAHASGDPAVRRALLHFVVVGGNFTGVELAGEFQVFLREAAHRYRDLDPRECRVTLVEMADRILGALDPQLSEYARTQMEKRGTTVLLGTTATEVARTGVTLSTGERLSACTTIWCAGIAPPPVLPNLGLPLERHGYLHCDPDQRVHGFEDVWAIGDCAAHEVAGKALPATAQRAVRDGAHVAKNLHRVLTGKPPEPFRFDDAGSLAALGCRTAVAKVFGIRLSGFAAWFLWRTVYLFKMPGWSRRLRIAMDWTTGLLFPREHVQLGLHGHRADTLLDDLSEKPPTDR
ncbi:MAG: NAD(P)/FAD-dependent oxidoreductase [Candidatus Eisenbacteria bacterium]|uniref:NADH:ubiquinone reductase (non-electrogenic) n=1 Tax=Eiseniibacteriota bacterium TaxID=2212470 RepID=A0A956LVK9_UNCEI|nr:NAD(P)/FAD-dependent oxidoreductase [Candidatus Eisenbacteria bacterium]